MYVYSTDGTTIDYATQALPRNLRRKLADGAWSTPDETNAADFGWYPVTIVGTDGGDGWRLGPIVNTDGGEFSRTWEFDQALADAAVDRADRDADAAAIRDDLDLARQARDDAQQARADMDPDSGTARWTRETADTKHLQAEVRKLHGDIRQLNAIIVRLIRAQRLDQ